MKIGTVTFKNVVEPSVIQKGHADFHKSHIITHPLYPCSLFLHFQNCHSDTTPCTQESTMTCINLVLSPTPYTPPPVYAFTSSGSSSCCCCSSRTDSADFLDLRLVLCLEGCLLPALDFPPGAALCEHNCSTIIIHYPYKN